jgi:two-component system, sensor histidine kinase and response regulator
MDGFAVAEQMAAHPELGGATIMMLTSSGQFGDSTRCRELGISAYLTKPIKHADLFNAFCRTLQGLGPRSPDPRIDSHDASIVPARILLAEDNIVNQRVAVGLLTRRGHTVDVVSNGLEAIAAMVSSSYDVVLMDIQMPEMGGIEATRTIRDGELPAGRHTRIVALTAHAMAGDRERYLTAGMDGYLSKPIEPGALFAAVELRPPLSDRRVSDRRSSERRSPAPPGVQEIAPIGAEQIAPLGVEEMRRRLGSDELVAEVTEMFLVDCPVRLAQIKAAVAARDRDAIRTTSHAFRGAAANLSAAPVIECAAALESMAANGSFDPITADATCARLEMESARLVMVLRAGLADPARSAE